MQTQEADTRTKDHRPCLRKRSFLLAHFSPLADFGFVLNKQEFHDAILLQYNFKVRGVAAACACGEQNTVNHALICKLGGYVALRHNSSRDTTAELMKSHGTCK